jgi:hypothetical protein
VNGANDTPKRCHCEERAVVWCGPCGDSVPDLRNLQKQYAKDPSFVLIGVVVWTQYRDKDRLILRVFNIRAFPTYVIIDHEGIVRYGSGMSWSHTANLDNEIRKQLKIIANRAESL